MSKLSFLQEASIHSETATMLSAVNASLRELGATVTDAGRAYANESLSENHRHTIKNGTERLQGAIERQLSLKGFNLSGVTKSGWAAACEGALLAMNASNVLRNQQMVVVDAPVGATNWTGVFGSAVSDGTGQRMRPAREAYDERDNSNVLANTVTYNLLAGRQSPAAELFFQTVAVPADNVGISVTIRLYQVLEDKNRLLSGDRVNFDRRNLIEGMIDDKILRNDTTRAVPVFRAGENEDKFMAGITPVGQLIEGRTVLTAPLRFNTEMDLLALSADDAMLAAGVMDITDSLDTDIRLANVYLKVGNDVVRVRTDALAGNNFIYVGQDNYRVQKLQLRTKQLIVDKYSKTFAGADLAEAALQPIKQNDYIVKISGVFTGEVNINEGYLQVESPMKPKVDAVYDYNTKQLLLPATAAAIITAIEGGTWAGFDVEARRANSNRRERGDLVDTQYYTQQWAVPLRSPVTALRPVNASGSTEADDMEKLAATTYIRTTGAAHATIFETVDQLRQMRGQHVDPKAMPESLGVGRWLVRSLLLEETIDAAKNVASLTSSELEDDISAMLVNRIRDMYYRLYRDSWFQAVVESGAAGTTKQPTCIAMADPMVARYLMVKGDIRTIGPDFNLSVQTSPNKRVENKIVIAMGYPEQGGSNQINPLHFGQMLWSPELALVLPISRKGQTSKELTVQPRFRHIVNVPVMGVLTVENLSQVVHARVPVDFNELP